MLEQMIQALQLACLSGYLGRVQQSQVPSTSPEAEDFTDQVDWLRLFQRCAFFRTR